MNNDNRENKEQRSLDCNRKIEYLKNQLADKEKCKEFSKKICDYIKSKK